MSDDNDRERQHELAVGRRIRAARARGKSSLREILQECEGADPRLVARLMVSLPLAPATESVPLRIAIRDHHPSTFGLPAPDPSLSQWWFSTDGITHLVGLAEQRAVLFENPRLLCLGTPSLAALLGKRCLLTALDADPDVVDAITGPDSMAQHQVYDAAEELPANLAASMHIVLLDPPWYDPAIRTFINRGLQAAVSGGEVFCTLPGRLTRPEVERSRAELVQDLIAAGHEILALEHGTVRYQVPRFEVAALSRETEFPGMPWRAGDLLHMRKGTDRVLPRAEMITSTSLSFSRRPTEFRVFVRGTATLDANVCVRRLDKYSANISTRAHAGEQPDLWTTEKIGVQVGNLEATKLAVGEWASGASREDTTASLVKAGHSEALAEDLTSRLDRECELWAKFAAPPPFRSAEQIDRARRALLSEFAATPSQRVHADESDGFRSAFRRDRDRVMWSAGLRRLSNKTQLFPTRYDDDLRQRLTHSMEVSQLASTIGASFGLDPDLIEAGALAHDVGHTPFGHAGEDSLNKLFEAISPELGGFNHYEHGVDVLVYLEAPYYVSSATPFLGLNLTSEVVECVLKHSFCHRGASGFATEALLTRTKHNLIQPGYCHLEGQAVRVADKVSYLISDLEDGVRLGALTREDLEACRFFHRPPLDFSPQEGISLYDQFLEQRRWVLKLLMEDIINASAKRLALLSDKSPNGVRNLNDYVIQHSDEMNADVHEIWQHLQADLLHRDRRVVAANLHASRVVSELAVLYAVMPHLVEPKFRNEHARTYSTPYMDYYRGRVGRKVTLRRELISFLPMHLMIGTQHTLGADFSIDVEHLILAKDYVAALSDARARLSHEQFLKGEAVDGRR